MTLRDGAVDLWAMAAELERQFAGYKQRLVSSGRISSVVDDDDAAHVLVLAAPDDGGGAGVVSNGLVEEEDAAVGGVRGRMYEAYTRRRDERLRSVWRARMERKEAEVMALWAQLGRGGPAAAEDDGAAGEVGNSVTVQLQPMTYSVDVCGRCHDTYVPACLPCCGFRLSWSTPSNTRRFWMRTVGRCGSAYSSSACVLHTIEIVHDRPMHFYLD